MPFRPSEIANESGTRRVGRHSDLRDAVLTRKQGEAPCKPFLIEPQDVERIVIAPDLAVPVIGPEPLIEDFGDLDRALSETDSAWHGHALRFMRLDLDVHAFASIGSGDCSGAIDSRVAMAGRDPANGLTRFRVETAKATLRQKSCPRRL
jgi:hypothetical protein